MRKALVLSTVVFAASCGTSRNTTPRPDAGCTDSCPSVGATQCNAAQLQTCLADGDGCLAWSAATPCPATQVCDAQGERCVEETPSCTSKCPRAGDTKCSGSEIATCETLSNGCRDWGLPRPCAAGKTCDDAKDTCVPRCSASAVVAACAAAAARYGECCADEFEADEVCIEFGGDDPITFCNAEAAKSCATLHADWLAQGVCCCPRDSVCDPEYGFDCSRKCTGPSDCAASPCGPACAPMVNAGEDKIVDRMRVCRPADGAAWHGCAASAPSCPEGYDCWKDGQENRTCVRSCDANAACNNVGVACCLKPPDVTCDNAATGCANTGGCLPCK